MPTRPCAVGLLADLEEDLADRILDPAVGLVPGRAARLAVGAGALDERFGVTRLIADLGLDLVDDARMWLGSSGGLDKRSDSMCRRRWYVGRPLRRGRSRRTSQADRPRRAR